MVQAVWQPVVTPAEADDLFMLMLEDDTEEAPWMVMGDLQYWSTSDFSQSLRVYGRQQGLGWYVAAMLPILYRWRTQTRKKQIAPDTFVAFVDDHTRESFDSETEPGGFPPFVLEVVSPSSQDRDQRQKRRAYRLLKAREYALFWPQALGPATLTGYRRSARGRFVRWRPDRDGRLWSEVLRLYLVVHQGALRAQTVAGGLLPTLEESEAAYQAEAVARQQAEADYQAEAVARRQAEATARQAEAARLAEAEARQQAEAEVDRLRRELARRQQPPAE